MSSQSGTLVVRTHEPRAVSHQLPADHSRSHSSRPLNGHGHTFRPVKARGQEATMQRLIHLKDRLERCIHAHDYKGEAFAWRDYFPCVKEYEKSKCQALEAQLRVSEGKLRALQRDLAELDYVTDLQKADINDKDKALASMRRHTSEQGVQFTQERQNLLKQVEGLTRETGELRENYQRLNNTHNAAKNRHKKSNQEHASAMADLKRQLKEQEEAFEARDLEKAIIEEQHQGAVASLKRKERDLEGQLDSETQKRAALEHEMQRYKQLVQGVQQCMTAFQGSVKAE